MNDPSKTSFCEPQASLCWSVVPSLGRTEALGKCFSRKPPVPQVCHPAFPPRHTPDRRASAAPGADSTRACASRPDARIAGSRAGQYPPTVSATAPRRTPATVPTKEARMATRCRLRASCATSVPTDVVSIWTFSRTLTSSGRLERGRLRSERRVALSFASEGECLGGEGRGGGVFV